MDLKKSIYITLILLLIPMYIITVLAMPQNISIVCDSANGTARGVTDKVGFCSRIGFDLTRSYYFGTLQLPVYKAGLNLHAVNKYFAPVILSLALLVWKKDRLRKLIFK